MKAVTGWRKEHSNWSIVLFFVLLLAAQLAAPLMEMITQVIEHIPATNAVNQPAYASENLLGVAHHRAANRVASTELTNVLDGGPMTIGPQAPTPNTLHLEWATATTPYRYAASVRLVELLAN